MKKIILLLWLIILQCPMVFGATKSTSERKHIILAFDGATIFKQTDKRIKNTVFEILYGENGLLEDGDMLSVVCAVGNTNNYKDPLVKVRLNRAKVEGDSVKQKLYNEWDNYVKPDWFSHNPNFYSLLSITKPYIIEALKSNNTTEYADRTLILYVTDNIFNGNNYYEESKYFLNNIVNNGKEFYDALDLFMSVCTNITKEYSINYIEGKRVQINYNYAYFDQFELVHNHQSINLPTVLSYRPIIEAKRQKGGKYSFNFDIKAYNEHFDVLSLEAYGCISEDDKLENKTNNALQLIYTRDKLPLGQNDVISGEFHKSASFETLHLKSLIHINEDVYGSTRFNLEHDVEIVLEPDATIIFGKFVLPDFVWFPWCDNQYEVAVCVDIILVILIIIAFIIYILCRRSYIPTNGDITMGFYRVNNKEQ